MESAIAPALRCPRTQPRRIDDDYAPPFLAWTARADPAMGQVVMAYCGVQSRGEEHRAAALSTLAGITAGFASADGPLHHDLAHGEDAAGYDNWVAIAYWSDPAAFERWRARPEIRDWWADPVRLDGPIGCFREILMPTAPGFETLFSAQDRMEGIGVMMGGRSDEPIQEHGYWGSMRERLPLGQTDALVPSDDVALIAGAPGHGRRARLRGHRHLAVIRSGQDWTDTSGRERSLYLDDMEPILRVGMDFLRDHGGGIGCYANRYMHAIDASGASIEKSFGYSQWRSLAALEAWAESHPTHVAIFGTFMRIVGELRGQLQLRLYHEVSVLQSTQQDYEYVNCHPATGMAITVSD